jgi:hypothetical protein
MLALAKARGDQRINPDCLACAHVRRAEIANVRQQHVRFAQFVRKRIEIIQYRFDLLLVVGGLNHIRGDRQQAVRRHRLRVVALLEAAAGYRHDARVFIGQIDLIRGEPPFDRGRRWFAAWFFARDRGLRRPLRLMLGQFPRETFASAGLDLASVLV